MVIYRCKYCKAKVGAVPWVAVKDIILDLQRKDEECRERFLRITERGELEVRCICDICEHSLGRNPDYYIVEKWLQ